jgi:hypothetical protein
LSIPPGWLPTDSGDAIILGFDACAATFGRGGGEGAGGSPAGGGGEGSGGCLPGRPRNGAIWVA